MYRSKALALFALAALFVFGVAIEASAATYRWIGDGTDQSFKVRLYWQDVTNNSPATNAEMDNLLSDTSLGAVFDVNNRAISIRPRDAADTMLTVNAPFYFHGSATTSDGMTLFEQLFGSKTFTFNDLYFQGVMNCSDPGATVHFAGNMTITGATNFRSDARNAGRPVWLDMFIDASRVDNLGILHSGKTNANNLGTLYLNNSNTAFWGSWLLRTRVYANVAGCLGDGDVEVGASTATSTTNALNYGILAINDAGAISPTAQLTLCYDTANLTYGQIQNNLAISVRKLTLKTLSPGPIDPNDPNATVPPSFTTVSLPAGVYTADSNGLTGYWVAGSTGSITVGDPNATVATLTMECKDTGNNPIAGDTGLMPRAGIVKDFKLGYVVRIRAPHTLSLSGSGYTFSNWTGAGIANVTAEDTTVTMDATKTVTAVYTKALGASAPVPADKLGGISVATGISWTPDPAATVQSVYFGTSTAVYDAGATAIYTGDGSLSSLTNSQIGCTLSDKTNYYWQVRSNVSGDAMPHWIFTTGTTKVTTPTPVDNANGQEKNLTLQWVSPDAGATSYDVYFGTSRSAVENGLVTPVNVTATALAKTGLSDGMWYYWRVDTRFACRATIGDVWGFRIIAKKIYLDTSALTALDESSNPIAGVTATADDANVAVFKFNSFNYGLDYDVVVSGTRRLAIWSDNSINFGGVLSVSAPSNGTQESGQAIAGGYIGGPAEIQYTDSSLPSYWCTPIRMAGGASRTNSNYHWSQGDMNYYRDQHPGDANYKPLTSDLVYGPGRPYAQYNYEVATNSQYPKIAKDSRSGTGGTYGGHGGNSTKVPIGQAGSHAAVYAMDWAAPQLANYLASSQNLPGYYGQKEVYELWGGSGGSGGMAGLGTAVNANSMGGGGGGGVVEIFTRGNLTIGANAQILSNGGDTVVYGSANRAGGAGSGGSIRLVAAGNMTLSGTVAAMGGHGADSTRTSNYAGPGGGGGRIAIYKGGTLNSAGGVVTVAGGSSGTYLGIPADLLAWQSGTSGTIYGLEAGEGAATIITGAHLPIPADGARGINAGTVQLTWLPGLGSVANTVYFGTTTSPGVLTSVAGGRARKSASASVVLNTKYYWRVDCDGVTGPLWTFRSTGYEAKNPTPATGAINVTTTGLQLKWEDGYPDPNTITKREVFFGTDQIAVANAGTTSPLKIATVTDKANLVVNLTPLLAETTYYWKVDTFASVSPTYLDGLVWSLRTRSPLCQGVMSGDFNNDCQVDFVDFALLAANWKQCNRPLVDCP